MGSFLAQSIKDKFPTIEHWTADSLSLLQENSTGREAFFQDMIDIFTGNIL